MKTLLLSLLAAVLLPSCGSASSNYVPADPSQPGTTLQMPAPPRVYHDIAAPVASSPAQ